MNREKLQQCAEYCRKYWPEECRHILTIAEDTLQQRFVFDLPWDMEPTTEPVIFSDQIDWQYLPDGDAEFIYQFNRHRFWICLGQAYALTGDRRYPECFGRQLTDWLAANPITEATKKTTWRTIEAGIRGENWLKAMEYFKEELPCEVMQQFLKGMRVHGEYLWNTRVPFSDKSNWGVLESRGLFCIGVALIQYGGTAGYAEDGRRYIEEALVRLERELQLQVMPDGVQWEQSPMYHNEVLKCVLEVMRIAKKLDVILPQKLIETARAMAYADLAWRKPDGTQPSCGDSDVTDLRDVLTAAAWLLKDPVLKAAGYPVLDYQSIWEYGPDAAAEYENMQDLLPGQCNYELPDSGHYILRSDWTKDADYFHFVCGSMGGGHGHFDRLHIDLVLGGEDILVDPGRYTYVDGAMRRYLKSSAAHNVPILDNREYTECIDSWNTGSNASYLTGPARQTGEYTLLQGVHTGYQERGVLVQRQIVAIGTDIYVIIDRFLGAGRHKISQYYHFAPQGHVTRTENGFRYEGQRQSATFCVLQEADIQLSQKPCSGQYNRLQMADCAEVSMETVLPAAMITVISGNGILGDDGKQGAVLLPAECPVTGEKLPLEQAQVVKITGEAAEWLLMMNYQDNGADREYIGAEGYYGLGRVMVCRTDGGNKVPDILQW